MTGKPSVIIAFCIVYNVIITYIDVRKFYIKTCILEGGPNWTLLIFCKKKHYKTLIGNKILFLSFFIFLFVFIEGYGRALYRANDLAH